MEEAGVVIAEAEAVMRVVEHHITTMVHLATVVRKCKEESHKKAL